MYVRFLCIPYIKYQRIAGISKSFFNWYDIGYVRESFNFVQDKENTVVRS